ncbi:MAG: 2,3-bisphosphoglycerate-independent phosphoglycerate mutase [Alphaproteobacteria bacterium]|nr:2,3-bisphosphoglycerate-independent phosphoglycerate mutase [Alphaproteobacteria bacterium]
MTEKTKRPVVLCILDGWGYRTEKEFNAIETGKTPNWHKFIETCPHSFIETSGLNVGLPDGQMGNSEVGHTNLGAGRVVMQDLPRIDESIASDTLKNNPVLVDLIKKLKASKGACHLMGLMSPGGVHSHMNHFIALARILDNEDVPVRVHAFLDGRDTPPDSARRFVAEFERKTADLTNCKIATLGGRYYAMDRDNRWERVTLAYDAMVNADAVDFAGADEAIASSYNNGKYDEFMLPAVVGDYKGMKDGDAILMVNFRADRAREITEMLLNPAFSKAPRSRVVHFAAAVGMAEYSVEHNKWLKTLFPPEELTHIFGEVLAQNNKTQLRIAETEKYAHVTFFFNGGEERMFDGEERILVPSPKVATYDLQPEMSAIEVTDKLVAAIEADKFDAIIVNYANGDMVGHTGIMEAAVKAVETVDACIGRVANAVSKMGGCMLITADHGNAELMQDPVTKAPYTAHTVGKVQAVLVDAPKDVKGLKDGRLADIAPTLLELMHLPQPSEMTGHSLIEKA